MSVEAAELTSKKSALDMGFGEELTGAETLLRCLIMENVEHVFGYPGGLCYLFTTPCTVAT